MFAASSFALVEGSREVDSDKYSPPDCIMQKEKCLKVHNFKVVVLD